MNTLDIIRDLYEEYPPTIGKRSIKPIWSLLQEIDPPADFTMNTLEQYADPEELSTVLAYLPPKVIYEEIGEDALFWTWINHLGDRQTSLGWSVSRLTGRDHEMMVKAQREVWVYNQEPKARLVKANYDLLEYVSHPNVDLESLLRENSTADVSEKRINDYSLVHLTPSGIRLMYFDEEWGNKTIGRDTYEVWVDSNAGISLFYKGRPNSIMSLYVIDEDTLIITQLQGVRPKRYEGKTVVGRGSSRGLMVLDWRKLNVDLAERIGEDLGLSTLAILGGDNNRWTRPYQGEVHLSLEDAKKAYDVPAQRLGFELGDDGSWYRPISS